MNNIFNEKVNHIIKTNKTNNSLLYKFNELSKEFNLIEIDNTLKYYISKLELDKVSFIKHKNNNFSKIILITQYYHTDNVQRYKENIVCLINNILNPNIDTIVLLTEEFYDLNKILKDAPISVKLKTKLRQKIINKRLNFYDAFVYANEHFKNDIIILSNLDIFFDNSLSLLRNIDYDNLFLSLSRYDLVKDYKFNENNNIIKFRHDGPLGDPCIDSNDCWIFQSPIQLDKLCDEIYLGSCGCDSIINNIMSKYYNVINPVNSLKAIHYHLDQERNTYKKLRYNSNITKEIDFNPENYQHTYLLQKSIILTVDLECICTICNENNYNDLKILLYSIYIFEPKMKIYILCDYFVKNNVYIDFADKLNIKTIIGLDKYNDFTIYNKTNIVKWNEFIMEKSKIMNYCLDYNSNVLYLDSHNILLNKLELNIPHNYDFGLSPYDFNKKNYRKFNNGFIYCSNKTALNKHFNYENINNILEQINNDNSLKVFHFSIQYNYSWKNLFYSNKIEDKLNNFSIDKYDDSILYDYKTLKSIHSHFGIKYLNTNIEKFNNFIINTLNENKKQEYKELLNYMFDNSIKYNISIPNNNNSLTKLCKLWNKHKLCTISNSNNEYIYLNNEILLDNNYNTISNEISYKIILTNNNYIYNNGFSFILWSDNTDILQSYINNNNILSHNERKINSLLISKNNCNELYISNVEHYELYDINNYNKYLELFSKSKFCLFVDKEINYIVELLALGVVPLITSNINYKLHNQLFEGIHYFKIENIEDINFYVKNTTQEQWENMSNNCIEYYKNNCSIYSSFKTIIEIIKNTNNNLKELNYIDEHNIILNDNVQKEITMINPFSFNELDTLLKNYDNIMNLPFDNINKYKSNEINYISYFKDVFILKDGLIYDNNKSCIYTLNNIFCNDTEIDKQIKQIKDDNIVFNFVQKYSKTYDEFVINILPRILYSLVLVKNNIIFNKKKIVFLLNYNDKFINNFLQIVTNDIYIVEYNPNYIYKIDNCIFVTPSNNIRPSYEYIKVLDSYFSYERTNTYNIIIKNNKIKNFDLVISALSSLSNWVIFDDNSNIMKNINLFRKANIVLSVNCEELSNIIFSNSDVKVIELIPELKPNLYYYYLCNLKNIKHYIIPIEHCKNNDFCLNIDILLHTINNINE